MEKWKTPGKPIMTLGEPIILPVLIYIYAGPIFSFSNEMTSVKAEIVVKNCLEDSRHGKVLIGEV